MRLGAVFSFRNALNGGKRALHSELRDGPLKYVSVRVSYREENWNFSKFGIRTTSGLKKDPFLLQSLEYVSRFCFQDSFLMSLLQRVMLHRSRKELVINLPVMPLSAMKGLQYAIRYWASQANIAACFCISSGTKRRERRSTISSSRVLNCDWSSSSCLGISWEEKSVFSFGYVGLSFCLRVHWVPG